MLRSNFWEILSTLEIDELVQMVQIGPNQKEKRKKSQE
jgi:hypothetical protein